MRTPRQRNGMSTQPGKRASLRHKVPSETLVAARHSMLNESANLAADENESTCLIAGDCEDAVEGTVAVTCAIQSEARTDARTPATDAQQEQVFGCESYAVVPHDVLTADDTKNKHHAVLVAEDECCTSDHYDECSNVQSCGAECRNDGCVEQGNVALCSCEEEEHASDDGTHRAVRRNAEVCNRCGTCVAPLHVQPFRQGNQRSKSVRRMPCRRPLPDDAWLNYNETFEYVNEKCRRHTEPPDSRHALRKHVDTLNDRMMNLIGSISSTANIEPHVEPLTAPVFFDMSPEGGSPRTQDDAALLAVSRSDSLPHKYVMRASIQIAALEKEVQYLRRELAKYEQAPIEYRGFGRYTNSRGVTPRCTNSQGITPRECDGASQDGSAMTPRDTPRPLVNEETIINNFTAKISSFIGECEDQHSTGSCSSARTLDGELERLEKELIDAERLRMEMEQRHIQELKASQEENIKLRRKLRIFKLQRGQQGLNGSTSQTERREESASKSNPDGGDDVAPRKLWKVVQSVTSLFSTDEIPSSQCI